jgi:hypothetical protein
VQAKMAGSSRLLLALYRLYFRVFIPGLCWAAAWWPLALMYWMARWLVMLPFNITHPKYMRAIKGNYARILGLSADHREVGRTAWQMTFQHAYHWIDFFRWSQLPIALLRSHVVAV